MAGPKLVLDAGPLINLTREEILAHSDQLYVTPAVIREIRDQDARRRLELIKDDTTVQQPSAASITFARNFAKLTGDGAVLSTQDIEVIALAYELVEDKSRLNQRPVVANTNTKNAIVEEHGAQQAEEQPESEDKGSVEEDDGFTVVAPKGRRKKPVKPRTKTPEAISTTKSQSDEKKDGNETAKGKVSGEENVKNNEKDNDDSDWSDDGWIKPENLQEKMHDHNKDVGEMAENIGVAIASRDFAVQNTGMQMGLALVNEHGLQIKTLRSYMQRCYACFKLLPVVSDKLRQFCPQCGQPTLTRVTTSVDDEGRLHVHLKSKMQWITRGSRYALPNPQSRRARRVRHDNAKEFYAEDQPEYVKAVQQKDRIERMNEKLVSDYVGPTTVDSAVSPFAQKRELTGQIRIGRGRHANATGRKTRLD